MRPSGRRRAWATPSDARQAAARQLAAGAGVALLTLLVLVAPFAGASGFAAPPEGPVAAAPPVDSVRGSVRPRGPEAPPKPTPAPVTPTPEPDRAPKARRKKPTPDRVWPLKADSFTFTQPFGCVNQIANFYASATGCPPDHPVFHTGIDLSAPAGTKIYAAASGWVTHAGPDRDTGLANSQIIIQSDGANRDYGTEYLHWQAAYVREGDYVRAGQPIAEVGSVGYSTGPHLHFSVIDYRTDERIDPMSWLPKDHSAGGYLGLEPNAKRFPIAAKSKPVPDYADPAPPPPPAQERVPKHDAKKAAKRASGKHGHGQHRKHKQNSNADAGSDAGTGKKRRNGNRRAAEATATPAPDTADKPRERRTDRANGDDGGNRGQGSSKKRDRGDAAPPSDNGTNDKSGNDKSDRRHRSDDGGDAAPPPEPTATPAPTGPGTNLPPPVPPVPGVPAPLVPGATAAQPQPTAAPGSGKRRGSGHEKRQKQKQKADGG